METIFVGDVGVKIVLNVGVDISAAILRKIKFKKTNGSVSQWNAAEETSTSLSYITANGDIDLAGIWEFQSYVETPTWKLHGGKIKLQVEGSLQ